MSSCIITKIKHLIFIINGLYRDIHYKHCYITLQITKYKPISKQKHKHNPGWFHQICCVIVHNSYTFIRRIRIPAEHPFPPTEGAKISSIGIQIHSPTFIPLDHVCRVCSPLTPPWLQTNPRHSKTLSTLWCCQVKCNHGQWPDRVNLFSAAG